MESSDIPNNCPHGRREEDRLYGNLSDRPNFIDNNRRIMELSIRLDRVEQNVAHSIEHNAEAMESLKSALEKLGKSFEKLAGKMDDRDNAMNERMTESEKFRIQVKQTLTVLGIVFAFLTVVVGAGISTGYIVEKPYEVHEGK